MSDKFKFGQYKICVEKSLNKSRSHSSHLNNLRDASTSEDHYHKLRAAFLNGFNWDSNSTITIGFMGDGTNVPRKTYDEIINDTSSTANDVHRIDPLQKKVDTMSVIEGIKAIVRERIQPIVNLKFVFLDDYTNANIRISFNIDDGAWSLIGKQSLDPENNGKATMNLGWFDVATTLHEFGHMLGLIHEHQNSRDNPISWNKNAVYSWARSTQNWDQETTIQNILQNYPINQINGSVFDPLSIMLYFFPASLTTNNKGTRQNLRFSGYDVKYIADKYPGGQLSPEDYYLQVYNQTLQDSINESNKYLAYSTISNLKLYIFVTIIILASITAVYLYFKKEDTFIKEDLNV